MTTPSPQTWTLRLKSHRTTILLHIDPLQSFASIKSTLLTALTETGISVNEASPPLPLPASASDIQLGRPVDPLDASQGFVLGEWETPVSDEEVAIEEEGSGKGKGKAAVKGGKGKDADAKDCPKGAGLKDGAVLAFRWEGDGAQEEGMWGVQLASFEDAYGVQNEGDVGARGEFEG
ncbi:hypothetical protein SVAN01_03300 [Stagonosporopsis vannaccii]|nr:hypothetical protein SVAN01_03300 [Stagonosporopsis vannaccii]